MAKSISDLVSGNALLIAIMNLILGLIMAIMGNGSINFLFWISGIVYIVIGIVQIVTKAVDVKGGLITIIMGVILIVIGMFDAVAKILVGLILILSALPALLGTSNGIAQKFGMKPVDSGNALVNKIITIVLLVVGVCLIAGLVIDGLSGIADILVRVGGIVMIVVGVLGLVKALKD